MAEAADATAARDLQKLSTKCQCLRWILIDEISMVSAELFAELQKRVAQAVPEVNAYKRRPDKSPRPFGGINVVLHGDNDQLRPVKATALFDRPSSAATELAPGGQWWPIGQSSSHCSSVHLQQESYPLTKFLRPLQK